MTWSTRSLVRLRKQADEEGLLLAIVHSPVQHGILLAPGRSERSRPNGIVTKRSGPGAEFASIVLGGDGDVYGRIPTSPGTVDDLDRLMDAGRRLSLHRSDTSDGPFESLDDRQARTFGPAFKAVVQALHVGVVGCGGTGSPTAMLLAQLGVGGILLVDDDTLDVSITTGSTAHAGPTPREKC